MQRIGNNVSISQWRHKQASELRKAASTTIVYAYTISMSSRCAAEGAIPFIVVRARAAHAALALTTIKNHTNAAGSEYAKKREHRVSYIQRKANTCLIFRQGVAFQ
jgi:hypothetical protein